MASSALRYRRLNIVINHSCGYKYREKHDSTHPDTVQLNNFTSVFSSVILLQIQIILWRGELMLCAIVTGYGLDD
jgi:hypothetical protein